MLVASDQEARRETIVGTAGWLPFDMTLPGGEIPVAGVTMVTVRPTHRRRGILRQMMRRQFDDFARARQSPSDALGIGGEHLPALWVRHRHVPGRGSRSTRGQADVSGRSGPVGRARLIAEAEALELLPDIYERARREIPGSFKRTPLWWEQRKLPDPAGRRGSGGSRCSGWSWRSTGSPEGTRSTGSIQGWGPDGLPSQLLDVLEALGTSPAATREVWRYLFSVDLIAKVRDPPPATPTIRCC